MTKEADDDSDQWLICRSHPLFVRYKSVRVLCFVPVSVEMIKIKTGGQIGG